MKLDAGGAGERRGEEEPSEAAADGLPLTLGERAGDPSAAESIHAALALADDHAGLSHARCSPTRRPLPPSKVFLTFA